MKKEPVIFIEHILESIGLIEEYIKKTTKDEFFNSTQLQDCVMRRIEIIGEAAGNLPEQIQKGEPEIDWRKITGLRNILIHEYFGINLPIVWDVVQNKLDPLETVCRRLLERVAEPPDQEI